MSVKGASDRVEKKVKLLWKTLGILVFVNVVLVEAVADSGGWISLRTDNWYKEYPLPKQVEVLDMDIQITDASGTRIPCLGYVQLDLEMEGKVVGNCGLFIKCVSEMKGVVQGTQLLVMLGINALAELVKG